MTAHGRPRSFIRLLALVMLAYGLVLNGLLGAMGAGAHLAEARIAAQLGMICTIHGMANESDPAGDPSPGKFACIEHCVLASASAMPLLPSVSMAVLRVGLCEVLVPLTVPAADPSIALTSPPPPPRGPPALI